MKKVLIFLLFPVLAGCCGNKQQPVISPQTSESDVAVAIEQLIKGMITADKSILESLTADELVYAHSNGRVQNKSEFISELLNGDPSVYVKIEPLEQIIQMSGDAAVVRHIWTAETKNTKGEPGSLRVGNMMVWRFQDGKWKLLARQGYKL